MDISHESMKYTEEELYYKLSKISEDTMNVLKSNSNNIMKHIGDACLVVSLLLFKTTGKHIIAEIKKRNLHIYPFLVELDPNGPTFAIDVKDFINSEKQDPKLAQNPKPCKYAFNIYIGTHEYFIETELIPRKRTYEENMNLLNTETWGFQCLRK